MNLHEKLIKAIDLMKSGKSIKNALKDINQDNDAVHKWAIEYGFGLNNTPQSLIHANSVFEKAHYLLKYETEMDELLIVTPNLISEIIQSAINHIEGEGNFIQICDLNDAIVVFSDSPAGMSSEYHDLEIYNDINELDQIYNDYGYLSYKHIENKDLLLSMFLKYLIMQPT